MQLSYRSGAAYELPSFSSRHADQLSADPHPSFPPRTQVTAPAPPTRPNPTMSKPSAGGLPHATFSLRSGSDSSCASSASTASSSSSASAVVAISQVASASRPACLRARPRLTALPHQVADNFTLPAASSTRTPRDPLPDHDAVSDACSSSYQSELVPAAIVPRRRRRAAFWRYLRVAALAVRVAVLAATLAVVVAADIAVAVCLFPRRGTA